MQVEYAHQIDAGEPNERGTFEYRYEYDIYRFIEGDVAIVARSYVDTPHEAHFIRLDRSGTQNALRVEDLTSSLLLQARSHLQQLGKTQFNWLNGANGYSPLPDAT